MRLSFALLPALAAVVSAQGTVVTAAPETSSAPSAGQDSNCNACFIVANVNQVIFADFTSTATASAVVSAGTGRNGSVVMTTFVQPAGQFSFGTALLSGTGVAASYVQLTGTVITLNGVALTSPTAYNVFAGYTLFTKTFTGGSCATNTETVVTLTSAISFTISPGAPATAIFDAENQFVTSIGLPTCSAQAVVVSTTVPVSVTTTTMTSSTTGLARPSSLPETSAAPSTSASTSASTVAITSTSANSTSAAATSTSTSFALLTPTPTIVLGAGSAFHPRTISASLVAALLIIPGIAAWLL